MQLCTDLNNTGDIFPDVQTTLMIHCESPECLVYSFFLTVKILIDLVLNFLQMYMHDFLSLYLAALFSALKMFT